MTRPPAISPGQSVFDDRRDVTRYPDIAVRADPVGCARGDRYLEAVTGALITGLAG
jgi:hypothetical protein